MAVSFIVVFFSEPPDAIEFSLDIHSSVKCDATVEIPVVDRNNWTIGHRFKIVAIQFMFYVHEIFIETKAPLTDSIIWL